ASALPAAAGRRGGRQLPDRRIPRAVRVQPESRPGPATGRVLRPAGRGGLLPGAVRPPVPAALPQQRHRPCPEEDAMTVIPARRAPGRGRQYVLILYGSLAAQLAEFAVYSAAHLPRAVNVAQRARRLARGVAAHPGPHRSP